MLEALKSAIVAKTADSSKEAVKEVVAEKVEEHKHELGMIAIGVGLAILGIGLMKRTPKVVVLKI